MVSATDFDSVNGCSNQSASATGISPDLIHVDGSWSTSLATETPTDISGHPVNGSQGRKSAT